jgi:RNA polymerase sigma-70 factor, ECF subfamily
MEVPAKYWFCPLLRLIEWASFRRGERIVSVRQWSLAVSESDERIDVEAALLRAGQAGDRAALDRLLALHERALLAFCRGILGRFEDAEDAAQETLFRALRALPRFRPDQATFRTWLFRIAINVCLDWKRRHRPTEPWGEERSVSAREASSPEALALRRLQMMEALQKLPPRHRAIFLLKVLEGWSVAEIGAAMGWNPIRVQNELAKARRTLVEWQRRNAEEGSE